MKTVVYILAAGILLCGCNKPDSVPPIQKWEYKVVEVENFEHSMYDDAFKNGVDLEKVHAAESGAGDFHLDVDSANAKEFGKYGLDINMLGQQGWELISAIPQTETIKADSFINTRTGKIILIFKRPAQ